MASKWKISAAHQEKFKSLDEMSVNELMDRAFRETTMLEHNECRKCGIKNDRVTGPTHPRAGDVAICINCGELSMFDPDLRERELTLEERKEVMSDALVRAAVFASRSLRLRREKEQS